MGSECCPSVFRLDPADLSPLALLPKSLERTSCTSQTFVQGGVATPWVWAARVCGGGNAPHPAARSASLLLSTWRQRQPWAQRSSHTENGRTVWPAGSSSDLIPVPHPLADRLHCTREENKLPSRLSHFIFGSPCSVISSEIQACTWA